ncbi:armadillo repeat-containing protein 10-like isoform X3 [Montipora foliosa]|uniref:armadillo repeat-containing protein 10-like isoform X3 n=1 Tax=Montipora foliosa TaxID=591990 RepID=UPI0035F196F9
MEGSWKSARIAFYAFCSTFAFVTLAFTVYYLTNHKGSRKKNRITDTSIRLHDETAASCSFCDESELAEILKKNGHGEFAKGKISSLLRFIETAETHMVEKLLVILLNCSAFTANQNAIRECGGFPLLEALLTHQSQTVNIKVAQVLSNLAMNEKNQQSLKDSVFAVIKNLEYSDSCNNEEVVIELLKLLVNLSATDIAHEEIMTGVPEYFNILGQTLSRQIQPLLILRTFMLPDNTDDIILRALTISANLLSNSDRYTEEQQSMITEHLNLLYSELIAMLDHSNEDIQSQAKRALRSVFAFRMMYSTL